MAIRLVDGMSAPAAWQALAPGGGVSTEMSVSGAVLAVPFGSAEPTLRVTATTAALNHRVERQAFPAANLQQFDELRFWMRSTRRADGSAEWPLYLQMKLRSNPMGFDHAGNTWSRLLPVGRAGRWELVRLSLAELPTQVRSSLRAIRLTCVEASRAFTVELTRILAVREEMIADVEAALLARLGGRFQVDGSTVAAELHHEPGGAAPTAPAVPAIRLRQEAIRRGGGAVVAAESRRDFTEDGFLLHPAPEPYDLEYAVETFTATRADAARVLGFVLREAAPTTRLVVNDVPLPLRVEWRSRDGEGPGGLHLTVSAKQDRGEPVPGIVAHAGVQLVVDAAN